MQKQVIIIMGAAGRDFHNFNVCYRNNEQVEVAAFTATQIPNIDHRVYPASLAGPLYPGGISIESEDDLVRLIREKKADQVVFSYSDVSYDYVMHKTALVNQAGADFVLLGNRRTMLKSCKPVIAVCAVRTGCGKSQTTRRISEILKEAGKRIVAVRHPMPYGDLARQRVQRFASHEDLEKHDCTIEEREEYEPHLAMNTIVYAGVDYEAILRQAEEEADVILWDGGNNDTPFYTPDLWITVTDPHRPGHEVAYYPGENNLRSADVIVLNKMDTAGAEGIETVRENIRQVNSGAIVVEAASPVSVSDASVIRGKRVLVVEDGPTLTHGGMTYGAGVVAAERFGASAIVDPRPWVTGSIAETFKKYPGIGHVLPAMGYGDAQIRDLEKTVRAVECDAVIIGTPIDLTRLITTGKPAVRVRYALEEKSRPSLKDILEQRNLL
ncbi:GTPase [bacterium]|nr:GTPase [bacterium]